VNLKRARHVFAREIQISPRSPLVLFAIVLPLMITFLVSAVFGSLFDASPRLGIVDEGSSELPAAAAELGGVEVVPVDDAGALRSQVERHDLDAGLVLPAGFDADLAAGRRPTIQFYVSGESLASHRVILSILTIDLMRDAGGEEPPANVTVTTVGETNYTPIGDRMLPTLVLYAVLIAALFIPAASLVDEREKRTIDAVLVTPTRMSELLVGKAAFAILLAVLLGLATLALNDAFASRPWEMLLILFIGSLMMALLGLMLGLWSKDITTMYTAVKAGGILVFLPALVAIFPGIPEWIGRIVPTYYFIQPIQDLAIGGAGFGDVVGDLAIAVGICAALVPLVGVVGRHTEHELAITV
jgi:ABC-2 type transport system permease protein